MPDATEPLPAGVAPLARQAIALQLIAACEMEWQQGRCRIAFDANRRDRCLYLPPEEAKHYLEGLVAPFQPPDAEAPLPADCS